MEDKKYLLVNSFHPYLNSIYTDAFRDIENSTQPYVPIVIDSPGGYVWNLNVLLDAIDDCSKPVITIASGIAMSCGAVLTTAGTKGLRIIGKNTTMMIHQAAALTYGKSSDMVNDALDVHKTTEDTFKRFDMNAGKEVGYTANLVKENYNADLFLNAEEVLNHGFADIIMSRGKALDNLDSIYNEYLIKQGLRW